LRTPKAIRPLTYGAGRRRLIGVDLVKERRLLSINRLRHGSSGLHVRSLMPAASLLLAAEILFLAHPLALHGSLASPMPLSKKRQSSDEYRANSEI